MKLQFRLIFLLFGLIAILASCQSKNKRVDGLLPNAHQVIAKEVIQTSSYTYVNVEESDSVYWLAINSAEIVVGKTYFWSHGAPMYDFFSKELKRKFPTIYFIDDFTDQPIITNGPVGQDRAAALQAAQMRGRQPIPVKEGISLAKAEGGMTISELFAQPGNFSGKNVKIRAEVVKFSKAIMNRNWLHIQDGTENGGNYDLTVTSLDSLKVGDVAVFEGMISLNKDFGAGYSYAVIMEGAKIIKK